MINYIHIYGNFSLVAVPEYSDDLGSTGRFKRPEDCKSRANVLNICAPMWEYVMNAPPWVIAMIGHMGPIWALMWGQMEPKMDPIWAQHGADMGPIWGPGSIHGPRCTQIWAPIWAQSGSIYRPIWGRYVAQMGSIWDLHGPSWPIIGITQGATYYMSLPTNKRETAIYK
jgi:hypothetical protein